MKRKKGGRTTPRGTNATLPRNLAATPASVGPDPEVTDFRKRLTADFREIRPQMIKAKDRGDIDLMQAMFADFRQKWEAESEALAVSQGQKAGAKLADLLKALENLIGDGH